VLFRSPAWDAVDYWALDLETSGLRPREDEILSVGMVPVRRGVIRYGERLYRLVRPETPASLSTEGIRAHHILPAELEQAPLLPAVLAEVEPRIREGVLLLHHAGLDLAFLRRAWRRCGWRWPRPRVVDTELLLVALEHRRQRFEPFPRPTSTALAASREALGLPAYPNHHALWDALATAELFLAVRARLGAKTLRSLL
jgi:DNA polymerase-3 subunit epsilon